MTNEGECLLVGDVTRGWAVGCSREGAAHAREHKPCQDANALWPGVVAGSPCVVVAVADGHGDDRHDLKFAVKAAVDELLALCGLDEGVNTFNCNFTALRRDFKADFPRRVVHRWREAVLADAKERSRDEPDQLADNHRLFVRYGTTLLAALVTEDGILVGQIGDGIVFLLRPDGSFESPFPADATSVGSETNSLCSTDASLLLHTNSLARAGGGTLFLATDGLVNAFPDDEQMRKFARSLESRIQEFGPDRVAASLPGWLDSYSANGSGDDITLALARMTALPSGDSVVDRAGQAETKENYPTEEPRHAT